MSVTYRSGMRHTENINQGRRVVDMAEPILLLQPDAAPLTVLSKKISKSSTYNPRFDWMEDDLVPDWDKVNFAAGYNSAATSIVVRNASLYAVGTGITTIVKIPRTGEILKVTAANTSTGALTVVRGIGSSAAAAIVHNDDIHILSVSTQEGVKAPDAVSRLVDIPYNYTMILKKSVEGTGTKDSTKLYGGNDRAYQRKKMGIEHLREIENELWFGERSIDTVTGKPQRTTGGVFEFLKDNITDVGGMLTEVEFEAWCRELFRWGSTTKFAFCSPLVISVINLWAVGRLQVLPKEDTYGLAITRYISAHGELNLVKMNMFTGAEYGGYCVGLDMEDKCIEYRYLEGRDTRLKTDVQDAELDGYKDIYVTEFGLTFRQPQRHAILKNIQC
jgi:hypothetical protein